MRWVLPLAYFLITTYPHLKAAEIKDDESFWERQGIALEHEIEYRKTIRPGSFRTGPFLYILILWKAGLFLEDRKKVYLEEFGCPFELIDTHLLSAYFFAYLYGFGVQESIIDVHFPIWKCFAAI